jgi:hypothetical protein
MPFDQQFKEIAATAPVQLWGDDIAELTIATAPGSNYFVKLEDMSGRPARAYFMRGGSTRSYQVPLGTFSLKYATGQSWCSESELFGKTTATNKTDDTFTFEDVTHWTVELILQPNGNLRLDGRKRTGMNLAENHRAQRMRNKLLRPAAANQDVRTHAMRVLCTAAHLQRENNSARSRRAHVFTQPRPPAHSAIR